VSATSSLEPVVAGGFEIDITERIDGVSATGQVTAAVPSFDITKILEGVSATITLNAPAVNINIELTGVSATSQVGEVEDQPTERIVTGVQASGAIGSLTLHTTAGVSGVVGTLSIGTPTVTGVVTVFSSSAYDRRNVASVLPQQTSSNRRAA
jgi:hypothetical protein